MLKARASAEKADGEGNAGDAEGASEAGDAAVKRNAGDSKVSNSFNGYKFMRDEVIGGAKICHRKLIMKRDFSNAKKEI